jgi:hypothetical protein
MDEAAIQSPWARRIYWSNVIAAALMIAAGTIGRRPDDWVSWFAIYASTFQLLVFGLALIVDARRRRA